MTARVLVSWSSGKDSAWALHRMRQDAATDIVGLVTTVNAAHRRVAMHAVREELLEAQARAAGLPLWRVEIPDPCSNARYEVAMGCLLARAREEGIDGIAFGDLFLRDIRSYRERLLEGSGIAPIFPIWNESTPELARRMLASGLRAVLTCVDPRAVPSGFAGRSFDESLLDELPRGVDPCGENGEFHTFAWAGPMFQSPIAVDVGQILERDGFVFADLLPGSGSGEG